MIKNCNSVNSFPHSSQMQIQHYLLLHPIRIQIHHPLPIKLRIRLMNNTVVVRAHDHLIVGIVVQAFDVVINMVCFGNVRAELLANQLPADLAPIAI